jgi:hypothetical protein
MVMTGQAGNGKIFSFISSGSQVPGGKRREEKGEHVD